MPPFDAGSDRQIRTDASRLQRREERPADGGRLDNEATPEMPYDVTVEAEGTGAQLVVEQKLALVRVWAVFVNDEEERAPLSYMLTVQRVGASGKAEVNRSGTFSLATGEETVLTTLPVSVEAGDRLVCRLAVFADIIPISEDQVRHHVPP